MTTFLEHPFHTHGLVLRELSDKCRSVACYMCKQGVRGPTYCCQVCDIFFHGRCANSPLQIQHPSHPQHPLVLSEGYECSTGWPKYSYSCDDCEFSLALKCAFPTDEEEEEEIMSIPPSVEDPQLYEIIKHPFHPSHPLEPLSYDERPFRIMWCDACLFEISERPFIYQCAECDFNLDSHCASMKPNVHHQPHKHKLNYFPRVGESALLCNYCGITCSTDLYRCVECDFNLHHDCFSLPLTVKDEHHWDPLSLCEKALGDYADANIFYCDRCDLNRDPDLGVYTCEECGYYAHIYCIVPKERGKRKKIVETVRLKWDTQITIQEAKVEEAKIELNKLIDELESFKTEKEQEMRKMAIKDEE